MRSEMQVTVQGQARARDRLDAVLTASVSVLFVEAVIGVIAGYVWEQTQEAPALPYNAMGLAVMVIAAPFLAAAGAAVCALVTLGVVMPLLAAAAWLGRTLSGREVWWWVPAVAATATAPPALAVAILTEVGPLECLGGWFVVTTALTTPALVARRLLLPGRPQLSVGAMFGRVALYGTLAVVTAFALAGVAMFAGIGYEPPRLNAEQIAGTYSDGKGGTLTLTPDGQATATRVETFDFDDSIDPFEPQAHPCTGTGTWTYDPVDGPYSQQVDVSVEACPVAMDSWSVYGTREHPKLYVFIGDPDSWELYTLRHS
ncbi:hypothetical protein [Streptomyces tanashiensis]|uniref:hypothetical protein n=1 Tax=Streptomyces tanashiensis TaxID=67367 RepID=UPI00167E3B2D|nr:hypothetical protein [Streptomyces tanashiensis]GGY08291.1 hypothetical protein GCM10010299_09450 [Streptomyces tanashiensis]